nr:retrovirus-related Pol polyprotein from transposon TNT 1-94 [Tanacetum cinerariifolium]
MLNEKISKAWKWWIEEQCPSGYKWVPKTEMQWVPKARNENVHKRVKGLNHNVFSVIQFCDVDLEVAFWKSTCFVRDLSGNDLLTGNHGSDLYTISLQVSISSTPLCLMAKVSPTQVWLWHRRLSHLNFDYINLLSKKDVMIGLPNLKFVKDQLCSSCGVSKAKRSSFKSKAVPSSKGRLNLLHMDFCGPMRVASINGKKYILVIVDDYSRYTWTLSLHAHVPSQQELDLLFSPLNDEFFTISTSSVNKSSSSTNNSNQQDILPTINNQPTSEPSSPSYVHAEENNDNQVEEEHLQDDKFTNPFYTPEEVCVAQPDGFVDPDHPEKVYRIRESSLWIETSSKGMAKHALEILHKHGMEKGQSIGTPMGMKPKLDADLSGNPVDQAYYHSKIRSLMYLISSRPDIVLAGSSFGLTAFSDVDHAGCIDTRKSTYGGIQFLGDKLVSWMSKKQDCTAMSSTKAKYVALSASCAQVMWMRTQLQDYGLNYNNIPMYYDS